MEIIDIFFKFAAVLLIVGLNAFFVIAEFAIVKVRGTQIEPLANAGMRRARIAQNVISHLDKYLSACQLGITMTSLGLGWVGEPLVAHLLEPVFAPLGIVDPAVISTLAFVVGFSLITFLHIVIGEQAPKWWAIQSPQKATLFVATPLRAFYIVFKPFIWLLNISAKAFLRWMGIRTKSDAELGHSEEELRLLLSRGKMLTTTGKAISLNAIELRNRTVREVMVPRTNVAFLTVLKSVEENIALAEENQFTRYPLCERDLDNVVGMIHLKDLFKLKGTRGDGAQLLQIKREMLFVPDTTPLEKVLNLFLSRRVLMAMAVDEYGGSAGLVTLENVLEELVGEIRDEFDVEPSMVQKVSDGEYLVDGSLPLHDFARMFEVEPESRDTVTLSGYAIQLIGRVPEKGASVRMGNWNVTIETTERKKVRTMRLKKIPVEQLERERE
jgi:CBS domain containing-hemolysin-like protein